MVAVLALVLLSWAVGRTGAWWLGLLPAAAQADPAARTAGLRALLLWPWLVGSVGLVLLALPAPHPAVIANIVLPAMTLRRPTARPGSCRRRRRVRATCCAPAGGWPGPSQ